MCVFCTFPNKIGFFSYFFILVKEQANMEIFCRGPILRIFQEGSDSDFLRKILRKQKRVFGSRCVSLTILFNIVQNFFALWFFVFHLMELVFFPDFLFDIQREIMFYSATQFPWSYDFYILAIYMYSWDVNFEGRKLGEVLSKS